MPAAHTRMSNLCPAPWSRKVAGAGLSRQTPLAHMADQDAALGLTCPTHGCYGHVRNEPEIKHFLQRPYPRHSAFFKQICESSKLNTIKTTNVIFPLCPNISFSEYTWKDLKNHFLLPSCGIWYLAYVRKTDLFSVVSSLPDCTWLYLYWHAQSPLSLKWAKDLNRQFSKRERQEVNKYMEKKCLTSLAIREIQIKTILSTPTPLSEWLSSKRATNAGHMWRRGDSYTLLGGCMSVQLLWETVRRLSS